MTSEIPSTSGSKKRRIMIITGDESIIEQIQNNANASLFKSIILDSHGDDLEVSHLQSEAQSSNQKKTKTSLLTCVVCGSPANGYNFDAITCESCKAFFRRNALKDVEILECRRNRNCDVTAESRRRCSACRLAKCFSSGMKRDRLLTAEQKAAKRRKIEENRTLTKQTTTEFEEDQHLSLEIIEEKPQLISSKVINTFSEPKNTNLLTQILSHEQPALLSAEDLERVKTIQLSYQQRIELAARDGLPWNPTVYSNTLLQHINARSVSAMRLLSFFKQITEFNELNVQDRVTLVKYNLMPLIIISCTLSYKTELKEFIETESDAPCNSSLMISVHGQDVFRQVEKILQSFMRIAKYDQRIIHLALIILILSKGITIDSESEPILTDGMAVYRAQTYYIELLWKYLETMHGNGKAVHIFNEVVVHFISWQKLQGHLQRDLQKVLSPADIEELLPIMKSLLHIP